MVQTDSTDARQLHPAETEVVTSLADGVFGFLEFRFFFWVDFLGGSGKWVFLFSGYFGFLGELWLRRSVVSISKGELELGGGGGGSVVISLEK